MRTNFWQNSIRGEDERCCGFAGPYGEGPISVGVPGVPQPVQEGADSVAFVFLLFSYPIL